MATRAGANKPQGHNPQGDAIPNIMALGLMVSDRKIFSCFSLLKVSKGAKIRNRYNQVPHLTQDTNGKVTNS